MTIRWIGSAILGLLVGGLVATSALADKRIALVIGNSKYEAAGELANPRNDARIVGKAFEQAGFVVTSALDLNRDAFLRTIRAFQREADDADWAVVYYAGHGIELGGVNYLIPTDAKLENNRDLPDETVTTDRVLSAIGGAKSFRLVILDACRVNPFAAKLSRIAGARGGNPGRGLGRPDDDQRLQGTLIAYAAAPGTIANDGKGENSPFATSLAKHLTEVGVEVRKVFDRVGDDVLEATNQSQAPALYGSLSGRGDFYFRPPAAATLPGIGPSGPVSSIADDYKAAERAGTLLALETFIAQYAQRTDAVYYVALARGGREIALEYQAALRRNTLQGWATFLDAHPLDIENPFVRRGQEAKAALSAKETPQVASLPAAGTTVPNATVGSSTPSAADLAKRVQSELKRVGCDPGSEDGNWGLRSEAALKAFAAKVGAPALQANAAALERLQKATGRVCDPVAALPPTEKPPTPTGSAAVGGSLDGTWKLVFGRSVAQGCENQGGYALSITVKGPTVTGQASGSVSANGQFSVGWTSSRGNTAQATGQLTPGGQGRLIVTDASGPRAGQSCATDVTVSRN